MPISTDIFVVFIVIVDIFIVLLCIYYINYNAILNNYGYS